MLGQSMSTMVMTLRRLVDDMQRMSREQAAGEIDAVIASSEFDGAYRAVTDGINEAVQLHVRNILKILGIVSTYADGDFSQVLEPLPGKQVVANQMMDKLRGNLTALVADTSLLCAAAVEGRLSTRVDADKHEGDFRKIVREINDTLDAVVKPLNSASAYIARIGEGDIPEKSPMYTTATSTCSSRASTLVSDGLGGLVEANTVLQRIAVNDCTRTVSDGYAGIYAEVARAVNEVGNRIG